MNSSLALAAPLTSLDRVQLASYLVKEAGLFSSIGAGLEHLHPANLWSRLRGMKVPHNWGEYGAAPGKLMAGVAPPKIPAERYNLWSGYTDPFKTPPGVVTPAAPAAPAAKVTGKGKGKVVAQAATPATPAATGHAFGVPPQPAPPGAAAVVPAEAGAAGAATEAAPGAAAEAAPGAPTDPSFWAGMRRRGQVAREWMLKHPNTSMGAGLGAGAAAGVVGANLMRPARPPTFAEQMQEMLGNTGAWMGEHPLLTAGGALGLGAAGMMGGRALFGNR